MESKVKILKSPKYYPAIPDWNNKIYMPISMNNRLIKDGNAVSEIFGWIFERTDSCDAIIGDYLHRHNIMIDGAEENTAIACSNKIGHSIIQILESKMKEFPGKILNIRPAKEFYDKEEIFAKKLNYFSGLYANNFSFRDEIKFLIHQFLDRQSHIECSPQQLDHCKKYILEELVIFEMLSEEKFYINIYPGKQLRIFKKIVTGHLQQISHELEKVSLVELRVKPAFATKLITKVTN